MKLKQGLRFGRLVLQHRDHRDREARVTYWKCHCDCGQTCLASGHGLRVGRKKSCGCLPRDIKHTAGRQRAKRSWENMIERCTRPMHPKFKDYGGRGIKVCSTWRTFAQFYADMGDRPEGLTLGRVDNDGNYEPGNCRWETHEQQHSNRRVTKWVTVSGERELLTAACKRLGLSRSVVYGRLANGWSEAEAFAGPARVPKPRVYALRRSKTQPPPDSGVASWRAATGMTIVEAAAALAVPTSTYRGWEMQRRPASPLAIELMRYISTHGTNLNSIADSALTHSPKAL